MDIYFLEDDPELFRGAKETIEGHLKHMKVLHCSGQHILDGSEYISEKCLLIMDLDLPGENSLSLLGDIREKTRAPIVVIDDIKIGAGRIIKALHLGAIDYLFKPLNGSRLLASVINCDKGEKHAV